MLCHLKSNCAKDSGLRKLRPVKLTRYWPSAAWSRQLPESAWSSRRERVGRNRRVDGLAGFAALRSRRDARQQNDSAALPICGIPRFRPIERLFDHFRVCCDYRDLAAMAPGSHAHGPSLGQVRSHAGVSVRPVALIVARRAEGNAERRNYPASSDHPRCASFAPHARPWPCSRPCCAHGQGGRDRIARIARIAPKRATVARHCLSARGWIKCSMRFLGSIAALALRIGTLPACPHCPAGQSFRSREGR